MDKVNKLRNFARKRHRIIQILSIIVLLMLIVFLIYFYSSTNKKARECLINPMEYYQKVTNQICSCLDVKTGITYRSQEESIKITPLLPKKVEPILIP